MEVEAICPRCGAGATWLGPGAPQEIVCRGCGAITSPKSPDGITAAGMIERCPVCESALLYVQSDFNPRVGCLIVALGAALAPWTYGISLAICALLDWLLYRLLPQVTICYVCRTRYRRALRNPAHRAFDIAIAGRYEQR